MIFIRYLGNIIATLITYLANIIVIFTISLIIPGTIIVNFINYLTNIIGILFLAPEYFIVLKIARK